MKEVNLVLRAVVLVVLAVSVNAEPPSAERFAIPSFATSGARGYSQGGPFLLLSTVGAFEGEVLSGGGFVMTDSLPTETGLSPEPPSPVLGGRYDAVAGTLTLVWPGSAADYVLEVCTDLGPAARWAVVSGGATITGAVYQLAVPPQGQRQFYRLRKVSGL